MPGLVSVRLSAQLPLHTHGRVSAVQLLFENRFNPSQFGSGVVEPIEPQPKKSLLMSPDSWQFRSHEIAVQAAPVSVFERSAHSPQPVPETAAAKKLEGG